MPHPPSTSFLGTCFSFVLVLVFTVCMTFTSVRTYVLYGNYTGLTDHFNTVGVIFLIFWIVVVALALRLLHPLLRLSPANFALVYAALMVAVVLPSMGFGGYFIPLIAASFTTPPQKTTGPTFCGRTSPTGPSPATSKRSASFLKARMRPRPCLGPCGPGRCCGGASSCWPSSWSALP